MSKFSSKVPKKSGYYWIRNFLYINDIIVEVTVDDKSIARFTSDGKTFTITDGDSFELVGPIPHPENLEYPYISSKSI